jgi:hypothetical protein
MSGRSSCLDGSSRGSVTFDVATPDLQGCLDDSLDLSSFGKVFDQVPVFSRVSNSEKLHNNNEEDEIVGYVTLCIT